MAQLLISCQQCIAPCPHPLAAPVLWYLGNNNNGGEEASSHWTSGWAQSAATADDDDDLLDWEINDVSIDLISCVGNWDLGGLFYLICVNFFTLPRSTIFRRLGSAPGFG